MIINSTPINLSIPAELCIVLAKGVIVFKPFSESITAKLSRVAASIAVTEKTPPEATSPNTKSFKVVSVSAFIFPVAASARTTDSKSVGAN